VQVLQWQWVGDLFKLWSWALSFIILARSGSRTFFLIELVGGGTLLLSSVLGVRWLGLPGLGAGYLATLVIYSGVVWAIVRREIHFSLAGDNARFMAVALAASLAIMALPFAGVGKMAVPLQMVIAAAVGVRSLVVLRAEYRKPAGGA
jgi:PST family polysaccharide transporter